MPIDLRAKMSGGGQSIPYGFSGRIESPFDSASPIIITPPADSRVLIYALVATSSSFDFDGTTISTASEVIVDNLTLVQAPASDGEFYIYATGTNINIAGGALPSVESSKNGESVTISTISATTSAVRYGYAYLKGV